MCYAVGVVLAELLTGRPPFTGANPLDLLRGITQNAWLQQGRHADADVSLDDSCGGVLPPPVAARTSSACKAVLRGLLRADPAARWTHQEFFDAPWLAEPAPVNASGAASSAAFTGGGGALGSPTVTSLPAPLLQHAPPDVPDSLALARSARVATAAVALGSATPIASVGVFEAPLCCGAVDSKGDSEASLYGVTVIEDDEGGAVPSPHILLPANAAPSLGDVSGNAVHTEIQQRHGGDGGWAEAARYPLALLADTAVRGLRVGTHIAGSAQSYVRRYVVPELASSPFSPVPPAVLPTALRAMDVARSTALASVSADLLNQMLGAVLPRQVLSRQSPWALALACHVEPINLPATLADLDAALVKAEATRQSAGSQQASSSSTLDSASSLTWAVWAAHPAEHPASASELSGAIPTHATGPAIDGSEGGSLALTDAKPSEIGIAMPAALSKVEPEPEQPGDPWVLV